MSSSSSFRNRARSLTVGADLALAAKVADEDARLRRRVGGAVRATSSGGRDGEEARCANGRAHAASEVLEEGSEIEAPRVATQESKKVDAVPWAHNLGGTCAVVAVRLVLVPVDGPSGTMN